MCYSLCCFALDLIRHGSLRIDQLRSFILDEADEMLNRGLRDQLEEIYRKLPLSDKWCSTDGDGRQGTQCVIVSATLPKEQLEIVRRFTRNPVHILVPRWSICGHEVQMWYQALSIICLLFSYEMLLQSWIFLALVTRSPCHVRLEERCYLTSLHFSLSY